MEQQETLNLDKSAIKAISVDTRIKILKILANKQQTLSDISTMLGLSIPTIKEHLQILENSDLIKKEESQRKWKYYNLTDKGLSVIYPERKRIWITLALFILSFFAAAVSLLSMLTQKMASLAGEGAFEKAEATAIQEAQGAIAEKVAIPISQYLLCFFIILAVIFLGMLVYNIVKYRRRKK